MTFNSEITAAFAELAKYDFGRPTDALWLVEKCAHEAYGQPKLSAALAVALNAIALDSAASFAARQFACKMLWIVGPSHSTAVFEKLLASPDVHLVEAACYAISRTPGPDAVLMNALGQAHGAALVAIVNLLGSRRVAASAQPLAKLAAGSDRAVAAAARASLGKIGTPESIAALKPFESKSATKHRLAASAVPPEGELQGFVPLFNGRNLDEWEIDTPGLWQVRNGVIIGRSPGLKYNDFLRTRKSYGDFVLRAKIRMIDGNGNSGIQFRSKPASIPHELEGYQADAGEQYWGSLYDESRRRKTLAGPDAAFRDRFDTTIWHTYLISAKGNHIRLKMDGIETVNYQEADTGIARDGIIALQVHAWPQPVEVWFRDLMIQVL